MPATKYYEFVKMSHFFRQNADNRPKTRFSPKKMGHKLNRKKFTPKIAEENGTFFYFAEENGTFFKNAEENGTFFEDKPVQVI